MLTFSKSGTVWETDFYGCTEHVVCYPQWPLVVPYPLNRLGRPTVDRGGLVAFHRQYAHGGEGTTPHLRLRLSTPQMHAIFSDGMQSVTVQMAEMEIPRGAFETILAKIAELEAALA